ncbi:SLAP domain-containing protein [Lactobacillus sp. ESL0791]|uniref:SLAP domain-containing protein n=1 Tax=Lactobacillus sp. ESL0791 TaxID=2983234 RepID=UPI0023F84A7F|nr:SLAP domain-containing protein [Lactobacillus sp. ESL0791]MDF7638352.1 SLAP domain-containing protein [Lactobacillus sp. ESL0791]
MSFKRKIITGMAAVLLAASPAILPSSNVQVVEAAKKNKLTLLRDAYFYNKNGQRVKISKASGVPDMHRNEQGYWYAASYDKITYTGKTRKLKGHTYYQLDKTTFLRDSDIATVNGKSLQQGKLLLNHQAAVYNKNGQRKNIKSLAKNILVKYAGKVQPKTAKQKYYLVSGDTSNVGTETKTALATKKIKGKEYYSLGRNRYLRADNVGYIDGLKQFYDGPVYVTLAANATTENLDMSDKTRKLKKGQKIKVGLKIYDKEDDDDEVSEYYRLYNYPKEYITAYSCAKPRPDLEPINSADVFLYGVIPTKETPVYTIDGKKDAGKTAFKPGKRINVDSLMYIWVPDEQKAELFYHVLNLDEPADNKAISDTEFVKTSDVKFVTYTKLTPLNTATEAQDDIAVAAPDDKLELTTLINKKIEIPQGSGTLRDNYEVALVLAQSANDSKTATLAQVKLASWQLKNCEARLAEFASVTSKK